MALSFVLGARTRYGLAYLLTQDGAAGNNVVIDTAQMRGDLVAAGMGGPLLQLFQEYPRAAPATSGEEATQRLLGSGVNAAVTLENVPHCHAYIIPQGGVGLDWRLTGVAAAGNTELAYQIVSELAAGNGLLIIKFQHTLVR